MNKAKEGAGELDSTPEINNKKGKHIETQTEEAQISQRLSFDNS